MAPCSIPPTYPATCETTAQAPAKGKYIALRNELALGSLPVKLAKQRAFALMDRCLTRPFPQDDRGLSVPTSSELMQLKAR